jgi:ABC-2 type transport system permease protein
MNLEHLRTFIWLRWRLRSNQMRRAGTGGMVVEGILAFLTIFGAVLAFLIGLAVGLWALSRVPGAVVMLVWDGVIVVFLFFAMTELMVELQRSEILSLDRLLHLPVSLSSAFLINYLGSLFSLSVTLFLPAMLGLSLGLVLSKGPVMAVLFPLVAGFFLLVTALMHQFRGWLASLMHNKRRRRTVITFVSIAFMLLFNIPNFLNFATLGSRPNRDAARAAREETAKLDRELASRQISPDEHKRQADAIAKKYGITRRNNNQALQEAERTGRFVNLVIPLGWLPYGALTSMEGRVLPSVLASLGLALMAAASLRRSYATTMRLYTGQFSGKRRATTRSTAVVERPAPSTAAFLERRLPWISEHASAVAFASFRSLTRAPESKMILLTPMIFTMVFGSSFLRANSNPSEFARPLMASSVMGMIFLGLMQLAGNQFGFDRSGFRVFVLAAAARKDILLGKNLALLPFVLGLGTIAVVLLQIAYPMRIDHFVAVVMQIASMHMVFCMVANWLSMLAPTAVASGSLRPAKPKGHAILIHLVFFFLVMPFSMGLTLIPLGIEYLLNWSGVLTGVPVYLLLTVAELALIAFAYPHVLSLQGSLLQAREQRILEIVAARAE